MELQHESPFKVPAFFSGDIHSCWAVRWYLRY